ncbi:MAG: TIGR01777 family oxidoreductase [Deltaproteobacteria bacterium]|nr:TIGR01777 family oxidoreductase [Deltaproteobacteria bacterium]
MRVFMTGGTGFVGRTLTQKLTERGYGVTLLTRSIRQHESLPPGASFVEGDPTQKGAWLERVPEHEIIINLAGAPIFDRWTKKYKKTMRDSRVLTTQNLVTALSGREGKETVFLSTSAVGYYGFYGDEELHEGSPPGSDFLATVTREWEASALEAEKYGVRVLLCRFGIVLGSGGGALGEMVPVFKKGLGSPLGNGKQWISWIHEQDLVDIYLFLIERKGESGPINCTARNPVTNKELTKALGEALKKSTLMPAVPGFVIKLMKGEVGSVLLNGQKVLPRRLLHMGFNFRFSSIRDALKDIL